MRSEAHRLKNALQLKRDGSKWAKITDTCTAHTGARRPCSVRGAMHDAAPHHPVALRTCTHEAALPLATAAVLLRVCYAARRLAASQPCREATGSATGCRTAESGAGDAAPHHSAAC
jgi:hypothetical protein